MTTGKKVRIGLVIVLVLLTGLGIYGNNKLNQAIDSLAQSGLFEIVGSSNNSMSNPAPDQFVGDHPASVSENVTEAQSPGSAPYDGRDGMAPNLGGTPDPAASGSTVGQQTMTPEQNRVVTVAERYLGRTVDRRDVLTAGNIIVNRFSWGEINYLYSLGSRGITNNKDAHEVRNMLLSRLSIGDIATLTSIGNKYGLKLRILDPSWD